MTRRRLNLSAAPSRLSITSNTQRLVLPYGIHEDNIDVTNISMFDIFSYPPNRGLAYQYNQARLDQVHAYWQSDNPRTSVGSVCLNVQSYGENDGTGSCTFAELITYPGSMSGKLWQNLSNRWYPTQPRDRAFHALSDRIGLFTYTLRFSTIESFPTGTLVFSINVTVRGKSIIRAITVSDDRVTTDSAKTDSECDPSSCGMDICSIEVDTITSGSSASCT